MRWVPTGSVYRTKMRVIHRLGMCWPKEMHRIDGDSPNLIRVWCQWCGMRGSKMDTSPEARARIEAQMRAEIAGRP